MPTVTFDFVMQLFRDMLGRSATEAEINLLVPRIESGATTPAQTVLDLLATPEGMRALAIERLYQSSFGRLPDFAGLHVQLASGLSFETIARNFVGSAEFQASFVGSGAFDVSNFVSKLYTNILGRAPDAGGQAVQVDFYNSLVASGLTSAQAQATLLQNFANAPEFVGNAQINFDKVVMVFAGVDASIPTRAMAEMASAIPLHTLAAALNDGVTGNGYNPAMILNQIIVDGGAAGTAVAGTVLADIFDARWDSLAGTVFNGGPGDDYLMLGRGTPANATVTLNSVETVVFNHITGAANLVLQIPGATVAGHADTLKLQGTTGVSEIGIAAAGVESIIYDISSYGNLLVDGRDVIDFTGSTALSSLTLTGSSISLVVKGFAGNNAAAIAVDASTAGAVLNMTIDLSSYTGTAPVTIAGGNVGNGTSVLIGSKSSDTIRGGTRDDLIVGGSGIDTLTGGAGNDVFRFDLNSAGVASDAPIVPGSAAYDTITDFTGPSSPTAASGFDRIRVFDGDRVVALQVVADMSTPLNGPAIAWATFNGSLSLRYGNPHLTGIDLATALSLADTIAPAIGDVFAFSTYNGILPAGDGYVFVQGGDHDLLIKIAGVHGIGNLQVSNGDLVFTAA